MRKFAWVVACGALCACTGRDASNPDAGVADGGESRSAVEPGSGSGAAGGAVAGSSAGAAADGGRGVAGAGAAGGARLDGGALDGGGGARSETGAAGAAGAAGTDGATAPVGSTMIVGVGSAAFRGRSSDGATWLYCGEPSGPDHAPNLLRNIAYGDGVFVAVGGDTNGMVMRSLDAVHWQADVHPTSACPGDGYPSSCANWMGAVAFHAGTWLAAGGNGAIMRSTDGGSTWKGLTSMFSEARIRAMGAGSGRFLAGSDGGAIWITADSGEHWTKKTPWTSAGSSAFLQFAHGVGTFIAFASDFVASNERACFVSANAGDDWTPCAAAVRSNISFVHDGVRWVTPANGGYATSTDAQTWMLHSASNVPALLLFDGRTWFGRSGGTIYRGTSPDDFTKVAMNVSQFRGWVIGAVLDENLPVTGVPGCQDDR